ncbi:MAG TPA: signal recognition particle-docking protein FtsY [Acidimicrobiales bacterium]|nr:signal recognition particle-docking protein FtsY [Acidimicrobiales bacterium]
MEIVIILLVVVVLAGTAFVAVNARKARGNELEPPPSPRGNLRAGGTTVLEPPPAAPDETVVDDDREALRQQVEEALAPVAEVEVDAEPAPLQEPDVIVVEPEVEPEPAVIERPRFRDRLTKARQLLSGYFGSVLSRTQIDNATWDDLEEALVRADVGAALTAEILDDLRAKVKAEAIKTPVELVEALKADLKEVVGAGDRELRLAKDGRPDVWLFVGVNGVGKTTTIGKVGRREIANGRTVVMAAGDTFRAAAAEQLGMWAERAGADLVRGAEGADPGSVVFDAVERAAARNAELVLADTAGRLHTKVNLMEELKKVRRVAEKAGNVSECLLVLDATTGQNGLVQAKQFTEAVGCTGVVLTKLDGTAKGGIAVAIVREMGLPIKLVGLGETADDLVDFDPDEFVEALFSDD